jgi:hypothetical protein
MVFRQGVTPVVVDGATYICLVALGHAVAWFVCGSSKGSRLRQLSVAEL